MRLIVQPYDEDEDEDEDEDDDYFLSYAPAMFLSTFVKVKTPVTYLEGTEGGVEVYLHQFLTSTLGGVHVQRPRQEASLPVV
jgi:hypothetical protein